MKKCFLVACTLALVAIVMTSCFGGSEPTFSQSDLYKNGGLWLEDNTQHYVRFTREATDETGFLYGREWHEDEDKYESDLMTELTMYGNGWFKYQLVVTDLTEIHLMDNHGAEEPKTYVVTVLTDDELQYYEKERPSKKFTFHKQVEAK